MKKISLIFSLILIALQVVIAQKADYKVVFDMSTRDTVSQQALIRELTLITKENPAAKLEVVIYGQAISIVTKAQSKHTDAIQAFASGDQVTFKACGFALKRFNLTEKDLLTGIQVVPDGIYEIISKQHEGWGYIKVAH